MKAESFFNQICTCKIWLVRDSVNTSRTSFLDRGNEEDNAASVPHLPPPLPPLFLLRRRPLARLAAAAESAALDASVQQSEAASLI